ncbi:probable E3 ubiquitin-protein ligase LOG2 [Vigna unguiculata]|uniref:probable E3 ubiquitin-protein ligase LOG2 n=1 Tax=Vigna unguiculata TaxID=3917 RepID=UPI0010161C4B|nr:probable E3 ubiquitin-protein ligase LOG2 [Vigna unguiculata]
MGNIGSRRMRRRHQQGKDENNYVETRRHYRHPGSSPPPPPYVYRAKTVTVKNDAINIRKESLCVEPDVTNPHRFFLTFILDATAPGCITLMFYAKEASDGKLIASKTRWVRQISMFFWEGLNQNFRQAFGAGTEISTLEEEGVTENGDEDEEVYPLVLKAETQPPLNSNENDRNRSFQTTFARFEKKEMGEYKIHVMKQVMWDNSAKYELLEIYGMGGDQHKSGGKCVVSLSKP